MERKLYVIAHSIRSAYNIGSIFRTSDAVGVDKIFLTGYSASPGDKEYPFLTKAEKMVAKTAIGAEKHVEWEKIRNVSKVIEKLKKDNFEIVALEQTNASIDYKKYRPQKNIAIVLGNEPRGINARTLAKCDCSIEIPMRGTKKSLNVSVAFGVAVYEIYDKLIKI